MDFNKRKVRFSLERLDVREVPAQLVALPTGPEAEVAVTAPVEVGNGPDAGAKVDALSLNFTKITYGLIRAASVSNGQPSDAENAGKVQFQDFHFVKKVDRPTPTL